MHIEEKSARAFRIVPKLHKVPMNVVGGYKIGQKIGAGGFAKVYKAYHLGSQKVAAVKIIDLEGMSEKDIGKIKREIQIHSLLKHPHIVRIYGVTEENNKIYIFMEYVEKGELFEYINENGPLPQNFAIKLFSQILSAINYLHENDIVHRDIKTENIVLDSHLNAKLIDFGLAKRIQDDSPGLHRSETICGSPSYCAPEIVRKERDYDGKEVDVWCLGVALYAMVEACLPFDQYDSKMLKSNIVHFKFHRPRYCSDDCADLFSQIFQQAQDRPTCQSLLNSKIIRKYLLSYNDTISSTPKKSKQPYSLSFSRKKNRIVEKSLESPPQKARNSLNKSSFRVSQKKQLIMDDLIRQKIGDTQNIFNNKRNIFQRPNPVNINKARLRDQSPDSPKRILDCVKGYK